MTGVCKCSQGWVLPAKISAESRVWGREWAADVAFQNRRFGLPLPACVPELPVCTRRQRAARQHSFYFQDLVVAHQCKILLPPPSIFLANTLNLTKNVSDKLFAVSLFTQLYLCGRATISILKVSPKNGAYLWAQCELMIHKTEFEFSNKYVFNNCFLDSLLRQINMQCPYLPT